MGQKEPKKTADIIAELERQLGEMNSNYRQLKEAWTHTRGTIVPQLRAEAERLKGENERLIVKRDRLQVMLRKALA